MAQPASGAGRNASRSLVPRRPDRSPRPIVAQTESAPTPALRSQTGPDRALVDFEANALYIELWHERHTSFDRVVTVGGPTDRGARRADCHSPHQVYWKNGSIVKVVTSNGSEYLFDDDLDAEWLDYIVGDNGDLLEPHLRFEDWLRLVKSPAPEEKYLKVVDPECPIGAPIMHMPVSGIDEIEGVDDVLAGRVEQGVVKPGEEVIFLPTHTVSNPCTGKVFTVEMHHTRVDFANPGDNVGLNIKGLDKGNMPRSGDENRLSSAILSLVLFSFALSCLCIV